MLLLLTGEISAIHDVYFHSGGCKCPKTFVMVIEVKRMGKTFLFRWHGTNIPVHVAKHGRTTWDLTSQMTLHALSIVCGIVCHRLVAIWAHSDPPPIYPQQTT